MGSLKMKDPPGGTTGRVKPYGRWGGWALAPNIASGSFWAPTLLLSSSLRKTFKAVFNFFNDLERLIISLKDRPQAAPCSSARAAVRSLVLPRRQLQRRHRMWWH